ncbi:MAG: LysR family transcriptional regulator [Candidatus Pseudobacter hemicellulosilyticus]|uniref:LysR family transcriptional regulator n=1 Tax=Candidatus Pseudobacter hemicellulosilyticus TaxID=3121375 RepID=A0AAJ6BES1_9BACT|nr:MAG: LysR family transcriptional regulator [Pseudobacter sp.]
MFDFRLKVFYVVARRLNFTKAAAELFITQPAVSKHIHEIEVFYQTKLFERNGTRISLTNAGSLLLKHTEELLNIYRKIEFNLAALSKNVKGSLKIGASTTVAQYYLPPYLASFKQRFPDVSIQLIAHNTEIIENMLAENKIDLGIVEGQSRRQHLKYTSLIKDELVLCASTNNPLVKKSSISLAELKKLPMLVREAGSGSLEVIIAALKKAGLPFAQLKKDMELESIESIKSYLLNSHSVAFLSVHSILKELRAGELKIIDVKGLDIQRHFYFITQQGDAHYLQEIFLRHLSADNFKL